MRIFNNIDLIQPLLGYTSAPSTSEIVLPDRTKPQIPRKHGRRGAKRLIPTRLRPERSGIRFEQKKATTL